MGYCEIPQVSDRFIACSLTNRLVPKSANDSDTVYDSTTHSFKFGPPLTDDEDTIELNPRVDHSIRGIAKALFDYPLTMLTEDGLKCDLTCPVGTKIDLTLQLCDTQILSTAREVFASEQSALRKGPPVSTVSQKTDATSTIPKAGQDVCKTLLPSRVQARAWACGGRHSNPCRSLRLMWRVLPLQLRSERWI